MPFRLSQRGRAIWGRGYSGKGLVRLTLADQGVGRGMLMHTEACGGSKGSQGKPNCVTPCCWLCMQACKMLC